MSSVAYQLADPAGRWLLDNCADAYGAHGFVYATGRDGVVIATGGDGAIMVGVYRDDDALAYGDALRLRQWDTDTAEDIAEAVDLLRYWLGADSGTGRTSAETSAPVDSENFCDDHGLPVPDTVRASHGAFGGYAARCSECAYVCVVWDCGCEWAHDCETWAAVPRNVTGWGWPYSSAAYVVGSGES